MANLACETKDMGFQLEQVQGFTPTPMTVATVIYYAGVHPYTLKPVYTLPNLKKKRKNQHLFFFWYKSENRQRIADKLRNLGKTEMIQKLLGNSNKTKKSKPKKKFFKKR